MWKLIWKGVHFLACLCLGASEAHGHQDTKIELKDGKLIGLPAEFQPARFDPESNKLTLKGKVVGFSPVLKRMFSDQDQLEFWSSWYHEPSAFLPCYLVIKISPAQGDFRHEILVDMETPGILEATILQPTPNGFFQGFPVDFEEEKPEPLKITRWQETIGTWVIFGGELVITDESITMTSGEKVIEHMSGKVVAKEPNKVTIMQSDGTKKSMGFEIRKGFLLFGVGEWVRKGSEAEKSFLRRMGFDEADDLGKVGQ